MSKIKKRGQTQKDSGFQESANFHNWEIEAYGNVKGMTNVPPNFPNLFGSGGLPMGFIMHLCGSRYRKGPAVPQLPWNGLGFPLPTAIRWGVQVQSLTLHIWAYEANVRKIIINLIRWNFLSQNCPVFYNWDWTLEISMNMAANILMTYLFPGGVL